MWVVGRSYAVALVHFVAIVVVACERDRTPIGRDSLGDASGRSVPTNEAFIGTFHLVVDGEDREPNLEIRIDHTFEASTNNSDANTRFSGRWAFRSNGLLDLSASPDEKLRFCMGTNVDVTLAPEPGGVVIAGTCIEDWVVPPVREPFVAHYRKGKMCPAGPAGTGEAPVKPCP